MGRVPLHPGTKDERYPGVSSWELLEHIGPMTRTVRDAALMLSVIAPGPDAPRPAHHPVQTTSTGSPAAQPRDLKGLRVAYSPDWRTPPSIPRSRRIVGEAARVFERDLGCVVEEAHPGFEDPYLAFWGVVALESDLRGLRAMVAKHGHHMTPHIVDFIMRPWTAEELTDAVMVRKAVNNKMWRFMSRYDLLLTPTLAVPPSPLHVQGPEKIDGNIVPPFKWLAFTSPFNLTGQPAATVPAGFSKDGLPIGLQIIGRHLDDPTVMRAAAAFEMAQPWRDKWPSLLTSLGL